jgi:hypothetical protein
MSPSKPSSAGCDGADVYLVTVSVAVVVLPFAVAEIVTAVLLATRPAMTMKVALWEPAGTVTLAGTLAAFALLLLSATTAPEVLDRVTVAVVVVPDAIVVLARASDAGTGGGVLAEMPIGADVVPAPSESRTVSRTA